MYKCQQAWLFPRKSYTIVAKIEIKTDFKFTNKKCLGLFQTAYSGHKGTVHAVVLDLTYRPVCINVLAAFLTWIKLMGP